MYFQNSFHIYQVRDVFDMYYVKHRYFNASKYKMEKIGSDQEMAKQERHSRSKISWETLN